MKSNIWLILLISTLSLTLCRAGEIKNVLLLLADDAGFEMGAYLNKYCQTPNLDNLARKGLLFNNAFTTVSSCSPSRAQILTGQASHANGMYGLHQGVHNFNVIPGVKSLPNVLRENSKGSVLSGIIGKKHVGSNDDFKFDFEQTEEQHAINQIGRNITNIKLYTREFLQKAKKENKPFFLTVAFHDPHRCGHITPQYGEFCERWGSGEEGMGTIPDWKPIYYDWRNLQVPAYLPDTDVVRQELSAQYMTMSRLDQGVGLVLRELQNIGYDENTLVIFTSDNGPPFPLGRTNLYEHGIRSPFILASPINEDRHLQTTAAMTSLLDIYPTVLEALGIKQDNTTEQIYTKSLLPLLKAEPQPLEDDAVFGSHNYHEITMNYPMRMIRTRRYKRPTDYSSGNEDLTSAKDSSEENSLTQLAKNSSTEIQKSLTKCEEKPLATTNSADKISENPKVKRTNISAKTITKLEKVGRHISSINQEDVQEALRNLKSPTDCPERLWSPPREIIAQRSANTTTTANGTTLIKISNHELNDEGFEETQSLVSDTPSHGKESTNSSCNEVNELPKLTQKSLSQKTTPIQKISSRLADRLQISRLRSSSTASKSQPTTAASSPRRTASSVDRARTSRMPNGQLVQGPASSTAAAHMSNFTNNAIRRATSMRKTIANSEPSSSSSGSTKRDVERSSSRNSLRSSRSSINSGASTQTVKRMPIGSSHLNKSPLHTVSVDSSPSKRPLSTQNLRNNPTRLSSTGGVPASRSSSSGSSVGPNIVVVRRLNSTQSNANQPRHTSSSNLGSTSFKENQTNVGSSARSQTARSALLAKANVGNPQNSTRTATSRSSSSTRGVSSFMRPTAASATKRTK